MKQACVGVAAATALQQGRLRQILREAGWECLVWRPGAEPRLGVDAWLLVTDGLDVDAAVALLAEVSDAPLLVVEPLFADAAPGARASWRDRVLAKLREQLLPGRDTGTQLGADVWVLAASTGGPEAVRAFLAALPPALPLALIWGQHIEPGFEEGLLSDGRGGWRVHVCSGQARLQVGSVLVAPAAQQLQIHPFGRVTCDDQPWPPPYRPSLDALVARVARIYRQRAGVIVFSGLWDDGAVGCRVMRACGGRVWVQSPESSICPEMPSAALATGLVQHQGSPPELAGALRALCGGDRAGGDPVARPEGRVA